MVIEWFMTDQTWLVELPERFDAHDGYTRLRVSIHDSMDDWCCTPPPGQQTSMDIQHSPIINQLFIDGQI